MIRLTKADYKRAEPHLKEAPVFVDAILHQILPGFVYTDDYETFLIGTDSGIFYVMGDETGSLDWLKQLHEEREASGMRFTLSSSSAKWNQRIEETLGERVSLVSRYAFTYTGTETGNRTCPEGYTIRKINEALIRQSKEFPPSYYEEYWGSVSAFLRHGLGYCIVQDGIPVCECTSIFKGGNRAEIDIATHDAHRGKGLAKAAAEAFIGECLATGLEPVWECNADNTASYALALKLGFSNPAPYTLFVKRRSRF